MNLRLSWLGDAGKVGAHMNWQKKRPTGEEAKPEFLPSSWNREWVLALLLVFVTVAAYLPVRDAGFIWNDDSMLQANPLIRQAGGWYRAWFNRPVGGDFVPATTSVLWVEWRLWDDNPLGYHADSVLLHVCSALLLWRILRRLKIPGAWMAAALFAIHPVNVESVAWIAQRKNTLAMLLFLAAMDFYLTFEDSGRRRWLWLAAGMFSVALMGKTAVVPLPIVLLGLAWWRRGRIGRKDILHSLIFIALAAAGFLMAIWIQRGASIGVTVRADSFWSRLAGAGWALWFYLGKALLPLHLNFVYPRWEIPAGIPLSYLPLFLWAAGLLICWRYRNGWGKGALLAMGYFTVMLLPVLGFFNIFFMYYSLVSDHWQYFAIIGPLALFAAGFKAGMAAMTGGNKWVTGICCATLLAGLGALTWNQCGMYGDDETLWLRTLRLNPNAWMAHNNLGFDLFHKEGLVDEGIAHFKKALEINPAAAPAHYNLGDAFREKGQMDVAITHYRKALEIKPDMAEAHFNLGVSFFQLGRLDEAILHYQEVLKIKPEYAEAHMNLGICLSQKGRLDEAIPHFQKALEIEPDNASAQYNLGSGYFLLGRMDKAIFHYQKSLEIQPNQMAVQNQLAWLLATCPSASLRNGGKAVELAQQANTLTGGANPIILHTLAAAFAEAGRFPEAVETAQRALRLAGAQSNTNLAGQLESEMKLYQACSPFHLPEQTH
jgi:Flp pilus assembly protein TadD